MSTDTSWRNKGIGEIFARPSRASDTADAPELVLPQVNLLPAAVAQSIAIRKIRRAAMLGATLLLLISGIVWALQIPTIGDSQNALAQAQATNVIEQAQVHALAPIAQMVSQIKQQENLVKTTLAAQPTSAVVYHHLLSAAYQAGWPRIRFATVAVAYMPASASSTAAAACPNPDPFAKHITIGCVTFSATAGSREQVSRMLVALGRDHLFFGPYMNSSMLAGATGGSQSVSFTGTVAITPHGLATPLTKEQTQQLLDPPTPAPTGGAQ